MDDSALPQGTGLPVSVNPNPKPFAKSVKHEASQLSKLALRLMGLSVNAAGCERTFSQMGLTHTRLRNRLGWAKTTHTLLSSGKNCTGTWDRPKRKGARVVTADDSSNSAAAEKSSPAQDSLMDVKILTSATEFRLTVNEWLADIDAKEKPQAAEFRLAAYMDSPAVVKAPLSSICGSALLPFKVC